MFNQHAKWLKVSRKIAWRRPIASLTYLLSSCQRQDHSSSFSHQDPGFVDLVANKKADIVRIYFPPDANTLLWIADHCLRTYDRISVIVAGKQPARNGSPRPRPPHIAMPALASGPGPATGTPTASPTW